MTNIKELKAMLDQIDEYDDAYYNRSESLVSDPIYDALKDHVRAFYSSFSVKTKADEKLKNRIDDALSRVGAPPPKDGKWDKVAHSQPMQSLNKCNTPDEFDTYHKKCGSVSAYVLSEKLDGISLSLQYENGKLVQALTRGDGSTGEDITRNAKKMKGVIDDVKGDFTGFVRGEIVLRKSDWKKHFPELSNPRNGASGIAKRIDGVGVQHLSFLPYKVEGVDFDTELDMMDFIKGIGFDTPNYYLVSSGGVIESWKQYMESVRDSLDYDIDGQVITINDRTIQLALGEEKHRPKGAIAFKFDSSKAKTTITNIINQTGDTGAITPVAEFNEVNLLGAKITRATLHNYSLLKELGVNIGAEVIVERANDVIPIIKEVTKQCNGQYQPPTQCPVCGSPTQFKGEYLYCTNKQTCPAQVIGRLNKWLGELNVLEWGESILTKLVESGKVIDVYDLYLLKAEDISSLDRMGEKSAQNLITELDKYREITLENFIGGLCIDGVATSTVKLVVDAGYTYLEDIRNITVNQLLQINGFGSIRANSLVNGLAENKERIDKIVAAGVSIKKRAMGVLSGCSICFTGTANTPRATLVKMAEQAGAEVKKGVVKGLGLLVIADPNSSSAKAKAAREMGIKLISEEDFLEMVK
jgi:DNA ligase (NAD+)